MGWSSIESDADRKVQGRERQRQTNRGKDYEKHGNTVITGIQRENYSQKKKKKKALKGVAQRQWEGSRRACVTLAM